MDTRKKNKSDSRVFDLFNTVCVETTKGEGKIKLSLIIFTTGIEDNNIYQLDKKKKKKKHRTHGREEQTEKEEELYIYIFFSYCSRLKKYVFLYKIYIS